MKCVAFVCVLCMTGTLFAQAGGTRDLVASYEAENNTVMGKWSKTADGIRVQPSFGARTVAGRDVPVDYDLTVEFTRNEGDDAVLVIVPIGDVSPVVGISDWNGTSHGLSRIDGLPSKNPDNPTSVRPGVIANGKRQKLEIEVRASGKQPAIATKLNGKSLFRWTGPASRLEQNIVFNLKEPRAIGLGAQNSDVTFHRVMLQRQGTAGNSAAPDGGTSTGGKTGKSSASIDLPALGAKASPGWEPFNGASFLTVVEKGRTVVRARAEVGSGDRGAYLQGVTFAEGSIELDLKGTTQPQGSFLGVVFHGVDGGRYDAVYFRPFNFGSPDAQRRSHAVQYIAHPEWPWKKLRTERSGEFEKSVTPEPDGADWFHARIEVIGGRVRVFVNNSGTASLDVAKLSNSESGKVGVWFNGVASFANLKISPAAK